MYIPSDPQTSQPASRISHPHDQPMPTQQPYSHSIRSNYLNSSSHSQAPPSNAMPTPAFYHPHHQYQQQQRQQAQQQTLGYYPSTAAMFQQHLSAQDPQAAYDETAIHFIDYSVNSIHSSSYTGTPISASTGGAPIKMRKRRAPYTNNHTSQSTPRIRNYRQNGCSVGINPHSIVANPASLEEKPALQEDMTGLAEGSTATTAMSATQASSMYDSSTMNLSVGWETPQALVTTANNEEQQQPNQNPKLKCHSLDEYSPLGSQTPSVTTSGTSTTNTTPNTIQAHTTDTVFIHSNIPQAFTATGNENGDYDEYKVFFPNDSDEHRQLRIAMHAVMTSEWKTRNELEPTSRDLLQFTVKVFGAEGSMAYRCLLFHNEEPCDSTWNRTERMLAHLRKAIDLRPFMCEGDGETACNCGRRFFAEDTLHQHRKNLHTVKCEYCDSSVTPRNKNRHLRNNCAKSPSRV